MNQDNKSKSAFARFAGAVGLANLGDGVSAVAWAWTASLLTRDPVYIALLPISLRLPWVLFALPSGVLADRYDRKRLVVSCDFVRALAYGIAAVALLIHLPLSEPTIRGAGNVSLYAWLMCVGFVVGCAEVARDNAAQSMIPAIVPSNHLERANGQLGSIEIISNEMVGPALGAFLIAAFLPLPFLSVALAFLCSALLVGNLRGDFTPQSVPTRRHGWWSELAEGARFVFRHPMLRVLVLVTGFWNFFAEMALIALVLHIQENLEGSATTYALILAVGAVGGVIGGIAAAPALRLFSRGTLAQWMAIAAAPPFVAIALFHHAFVVGICMFIFFLTGIIWNTLSVSFRQRTVPNELRGRANSIYRLFAWGMMPLGLLASGLLVNLANAYIDRSIALTIPFWTSAFGIFCLASVFWRRLGEGFSGQE